MIWLNEKAEDFALYSHVEEAFFRNHRKLDVSCIVERDLFGHQLESNANLREAAPDFKVGTLAAVAGVFKYENQRVDGCLRLKYRVFSSVHGEILLHDNSSMYVTGSLFLGER